MPEYEEVEAIEFVGEPIESTHKPIKVLCRSKGATMMCLVKICRTKRAAAASISEWIGTSALKHSPIPALDIVKVKISEDLYNLAAKSVPAELPNVQCHFGTIWEQEVEDGPIFLDQELSEWVQPFYLYGFDMWLKVFDRATSGNVLLKRFQGSKWKIIAADQSDCFGGTLTILDGIEAVRKSGCSAELAVVDDNGDKVDVGRALAKHGIRWESVCDDTVKFCLKAAKRAESAARDCPGDWAEHAGIDPSDLAGFLSDRANRLPEILNRDFLNPPNEVTAGGLLLPSQGGIS